MVSHVANRQVNRSGRVAVVWVATWHRVADWAQSRDLARIDLSVQAAVHLLWGIGISLLPASLLNSPTLDALFAGELLDVPLVTVWSAAFIVSGLGLFAACRWHTRWRVVHAAWVVAIPMIVMWVVGLLIQLPSGETNPLAVLLFGGFFFWHVTTAVRLWARLD